MTAQQKSSKISKRFLLVFFTVFLFVGYIGIKNWSIKRTKNPGISNPASLNRIPWEDAVTKVKNCEIRSIMQSHNLEVDLISTDGVAYVTYEPKIDDVSEVERSVRDKCSILSGSE